MRNRLIAAVLAAIMMVGSMLQCFASEVSESKKTEFSGKLSSAVYDFGETKYIESVEAILKTNKDNSAKSVALYAAFDGGEFNLIQTQYVMGKNDGKLRFENFAGFYADKIKLVATPNEGKKAEISEVNIEDSPVPEKAEKLDYTYSWLKEQPFPTYYEVFSTDTACSFMNDGDRETSVYAEGPYASLVLDLGDFYQITEITMDAEGVDGAEIKYSADGVKYFHGGFVSAELVETGKTAINAVGMSGKNARYVKVIPHTNSSMRIYDIEAYGIKSAVDKEFIKLSVKQQNFIVAYIDWATFDAESVEAQKFALYVSMNKFSNVGSMSPVAVFEKGSAEFESRYYAHAPLEPERNYFIAVTYFDKNGTENKKVKPFMIKTPQAMGSTPKDIFCLNYHTEPSKYDISAGSYQAERNEQAFNLLNEMGTIQKNRGYVRYPDQISKFSKIGMSYLLENVYGEDSVKEDNESGVWTYSVGNEPDYARDPNEWFDMLGMTMVTTIKAADSRNKLYGLVTGDNTATGFQWIKKYYNADNQDGKLARETFDGFDLHPYARSSDPVPEGAEKSSPEALYYATDFAIEQMKELGDAGKPLIYSEIGWNTGNYPFWMKLVNYEKQRDFTVRAYLIGIEKGISEMYMYCYRDGLPVNDQYFEGYWGWIDWWCVPKPCYYGVYILSQLMQEATYLGTLNSVESPRYGLNFWDEREDKYSTVLWNALNKVEITRVKVLSDDKELKIISTDGTYQTIPVENGYAYVSTSGAPKFIYSKGGIKVMSTETAFEVKESVSGYRGQLAEMTVNKGNLAKDIEGKFVPELPSGWKHVETKDSADGSSSTVVVRIGDEAEEKEYDISIKFIADDGAIYPINAKLNVLKLLVPQFEFVKNTENGLWNLSVTVKNNMKEAVSGTVSIVNMEFVQFDDVTSKSFNDIPSGGTGNVLFAIKERPTEVGASATFEISSEKYMQTIERNMNFAECLNDGIVPNIDGVLSEGEWSGCTPIGSNYADKAPNMHGEGWNGPSDCSFKTYRKWDEKYFYLAVEVEDDIHSQTDTESAIWKGDGIQFSIDINRKDGIGSGDYHELGMALVNGNTETWCWASPLVVKQNLPVGVAKAVVKRNGTKTVYEFAMPWTDITIEGRYMAKAGDVFGFSLLVNDDDGNGRKGFLELMSGIGNAKDTNMFEEMVLVKK